MDRQTQVISFNRDNQLPDQAIAVELPCNHESIESIFQADNCNRQLIINPPPKQNANQLSESTSFSEVTIDRNAYYKVLKDRSNHQVFTKMRANETQSLEKWYFIDSEGKIQGPLVAEEMDELFVDGILTEDSEIAQNNSELENFFSFSVLLKKYYKKFIIGIESDGGKLRLLHPANFGQVDSKRKLEIRERRKTVGGVLTVPITLLVKDFVTQDLSFIDEAEEDADMEPALTTRPRSHTLN